MPSDSTALLEAHELVRDYGGMRAVDGVDLRIERGEVLGLLGPNGAGKTSTLNMLCGTLAPTQGQIRINGCDLLEQPRMAKRALGYLPEQPPVHPDMRVREYLHFAAGLHGLRGDRRRQAVDGALERCHLGEVQRRLIGQLSKGYRQRVGIAQAILHDPPVIVLDEPTVGLDPIQIREIRALIAELGGSHAVILSTHILPEVQAVCTSVQIMHRGRIAWRDTVAGFDRDSGSVDTVTVALGNAAAMPQGLPGVEAIEDLGDQRFRLRLTPAPDAAERLASALVSEHGLALRELTPERRTLEQIFVEVTTAEADGAAPQPDMPGAA